MIVYGALLSPFVRKVILVAEEKGLECRLVGTSPGADDPDFLAASPFGKIPAMRDGDFTLCDSSAIIHYIEARSPGLALIPADPQRRGTVIWLEEFADTLLAGAGLKILFNRLVGPKLLKRPHDEAAALEGESELPRYLEYLEGQAPASGWLAGEFSLADIAVASVLRSLVYVGHGPNAARYPKTAAWFDRVAARPAWQAIAQREASMAQKLGIG
ncbi:MAG: glutathione S-transferase family protein [Novosphingobium sp.]